MLGAIVGGATLGIVAAALAAGVRAIGLDHRCGLRDRGRARARGARSPTSDRSVCTCPFHGRQVNEVWLGRYRPWVYASGFGWQIGTGVATYILTAATYLLVALAALTASPAAAVLLCILFGLIRGLAVFLAAGITTPARLHAFHRRFDQVGPVVRAGGDRRPVRGRGSRGGRGLEPRRGPGRPRRRRAVGPRRGPSDGGDHEPAGRAVGPAPPGPRRLNRYPRAVTISLPVVLKTYPRGVDGQWSDWGPSRR